MLDNNSKVVKLADDLSSLAINKVLAKDMNVVEVLNALSLTQALFVGRTMPKERYQEQLDKSSTLAIEFANAMKDCINDKGGHNIIDIIVATNIALEYILNNLEDNE